MTKEPQRSGNRLSSPGRRPAVEKLPTRRFPIQREIQKLQQALDAFNERIAELESEGHRGRAMQILRTNAMDFARQIDELRSLLRWLSGPALLIVPWNGVRIELVDWEQFAKLIVWAWNCNGYVDLRSNIGLSGNIIRPKPVGQAELIRAVEEGRLGSSRRRARPRGEERAPSSRPNRGRNWCSIRSSERAQQWGLQKPANGPRRRPSCWSNSRSGRRECPRWRESLDVTSPRLDDELSNWVCFYRKVEVRDSFSFFSRRRDAAGCILCQWRRADTRCCPRRCLRRNETADRVGWQCSAGNREANHLPAKVTPH